MSRRRDVGLAAVEGGEASKYRCVVRDAHISAAVLREKKKQKSRVAAYVLLRANRRLNNYSFPK